MQVHRLSWEVSDAGSCGTGPPRDPETVVSNPLLLGHWIQGTSWGNPASALLLRAALLSGHPARGCSSVSFIPSSWWLFLLWSWYCFFLIPTDARQDPGVQTRLQGTIRWFLKSLALHYEPCSWRCSLRWVQSVAFPFYSVLEHLAYRLTSPSNSVQWNTFREMLFCYKIYHCIAMIYFHICLPHQ